MASHKIDLLKGAHWTEQVWYKWTTWWNSGGDLVSWIGPSPHRPDTLLRCKGIVRREDGLIFNSTLSCYECDEERAERIKHRGHINGVYFEGADTLGMMQYHRPGRHFVERKPEPVEKTLD